MWPVSARWQASVPGVVPWRTELAWSVDGRTWRPLRLHTGTYVDDATSQVRWSLRNVAVSGLDTDLDDLSPFGVLVRVRIGIEYGPGDREMIPAGLYRCRATVRGFGSKIVELEGESFEAPVIEDEFPAVRQFGTQPGSDLLTTLIRETLPSARIRFGVEDQVMPAFVSADESRWGVVDGNADSPSVARALAARVATDRSGTFVVGPVPSLQDDPVGTVDSGPGQLLVSSSEKLTRDGVYNRIAVRGESSDPDIPPVGPFIVEDDDPLSPTFIGTDPLRGGFGAVTFHYATPLITKADQAIQTGRSMLAPKLGLRQQLDFTQQFDPSHDSGDVLLVRSPRGLTPTLLDRIEVDMVGFTMTSACRATRTRLAGSTVTAVIEDGGEGG